MNSEQIEKVLAAHRLWMTGDSKGVRANLHSANLGGANLYSANLGGADLHSANLHSANLGGANLYRANLHSANLRSADLHSANLGGADLRSADLRSANLRSANLYRANLHSANLYRANLHSANLGGADLRGAILPSFQICNGDVIVYKKVEGKIVTLKIPAKAKRTGTPIGRKCRAEYAEVVDIEGEKPVETRGINYIIGKIVKPDKYDGDIRLECTHGIHFFLTHEEAEAY